MVKRMSKLTALLAAAVTVVSTAVPVSATEALVTKEGHIGRGFPYTDGKYAYHGYLTADNDNGVYFNDGKNKDALVENFADYDYDDNEVNGTKYSTKYRVVRKDAGSTYLLDLSDGKIDDSESLEDKQTAITSTLKNLLKKTDRYEGTVTNSDIALDRILKNKYGEVWYEYKAKGDSNTAKATVNGQNYIGFVSEDGKYIDASHLANISVYSSSKGKTVKFEDFGDEEDFGTQEDGTAQVKASVKLDKLDVVDQDDDYIYAVATVIVSVDGTDQQPQYFLQKISKDQGDMMDGAYTPKSVESYQIDNKSIYDNDDMNDAYAALVKADNISVKDNVVYVNTYDNTAKTKVRMYELDLKKAKVNTAAAQNVDASVVVKKTDAAEDVTNLNSPSPVAYDVNGNTWILDKGKVFKFENGKFEEKYTCDTAINKLDVYDDKNLIAWDSADDIFAVLQGDVKAAGEVTNPADETPKEVTDKTDVIAASNWSKNADGTWSYCQNGTVLKSQWVKDGSAWYYLKADGIMATGWIQDGSAWYYLKGDGAMATGWIQDGSTWYYLDTSGAMTTGWLNDNGTWYYLNASGAMLADTTVDGYVLGSNGAWIK